MQEGPITVNIPATSYKTCTGCEYLKTSAGMRGRNKCTNHYHCTHPDVRKIGLSTLNFNIGFNIEGDPIPPHFCPFLKNKP